MSDVMYPPELLKGIPNASSLDEDGFPTSDLFYFKDRAVEREDDYFEESICWHDDDGAVTLLLNQKKEGDILQFKAGLAILCRLQLDRIKNNPRYSNRLSYERREVPGNRYHGNLLLKKNVPKRIMRVIAATISTCVTSVIPSNIS
jgi:hypothetical protein